MRPHPRFANYTIPAEHALGGVTLKALTIDDLDRDYRAVMDSAAELKAASPSVAWPDGLTREQNLIDLAWHQKEFQSRRSFTWVIEDPGGTYLGCAYVYPSITGENSADVWWWWCTGASADRKRFRDDFFSWLAGEDWPDLDYRYENAG